MNPTGTIIMDTRAATLDTRYLKTPDGAVYGPVDPVTLCAWAAEARVTSGCLISRDGETWEDAADHPELRLHWQTTLADGTVVGPLNLFALWELIQDGNLPRGASMRNRLTGAEVPLDERLLPVALRESRAILDAMAVQMTAGSARAAATDETAWRERLARTEQELADTLQLMGESQRLLAAREQQTKIMEDRLAETEMDLAASRRTLEAKLAEAVHERNAGRDDERAAGQARQAVWSRARAEADRLRVQQEQAKAAWALEREALTQHAAEAAAQATEAAEARLAAATSRMTLIQQESQAQAAEMTARVDAMRQAADALKADSESRLAEARHAVETAEARGASERQASEARMASVLRECAALASVRDELQTTLATARAEKTVAVRQAAAYERRVQEAEGRLKQTTGERDDARRRLGEMERTVGEVTEREASARREMAAAVADGKARDEAHEQAEATLRRSAGEAEAAWRVEREALSSRVSALEQRLAEADRAVAEREARLAEAAREHERILAEVSRNENSRQERADQRKWEVETTARHLGESRSELAAAHQALAAERERSAAAEQRLLAEIKELQRDLNALGMVKTAARKLHDMPSAAGPMIDWLAGAPTAPATAGGPTRPEDKFAGLDLPQQVDLLHEELKQSIDEKERLRREVDKVRADYRELERRGEASGLELGAKVTQLQNELQSNASVVQQTLEELERRESAARQYRKKAEEREKELQDRLKDLESELTRKAKESPATVEGEWEPPPRPKAAPPRGEAPAGNDAQAKPAATVLTSVEAQLRGELKKWHSLEQDKGRKKNKSQHWFRWKKP